MIHGLWRIGVEAEDDAAHDLHAVGIDLPDRVHDGLAQVLLLVHEAQGLGLRRLDAAEHGHEPRLAHLLQDIVPLGDVQCRLAVKLHGIAPGPLPGDEMWQQLPRRLAVTDKIVIDEVDRPLQACRDDGIQLGDDLLGGLQTGPAAVEFRDIAKFALIRAPARELDITEQIAVHIHETVGRDRKLIEGQSLGGCEDPLFGRPGDLGIEIGDERIGGVAEFSHMQ